MKELDEAVALVPGRNDARYHRARALLLLGRHDEAREALDALKALRPPFVPALNVLADLHGRMAEADRSAALFQEAENLGSVETWIPGDYHLQSGSPCIDTGTCEGAPRLDIEGHIRPSGAGCDMGAYEFGSSPPGPHFHRGDPNSSGTIDISDGKIDISDGIYLLSWLFTGGPEPAAPGPTVAPCGVDPDPAGSAGDLK